ncbi:YfiT family bacillithiol transferase [Sphingobacterium cellulitidis]|uniref:Metal-dependent hydrolase n=1 Tax=Sphingobacterium cellulitidis TaxID=1768011 RepID=A0A8H9FYV3_9SPHI|nr:putative metal-dependent hydrolase [Sphingobacterium soli]MBA8986604.1 putative damage-inducible protein DinB [Sphingobacterium soli]OYD42524.1 metal-dependent hydrolase [Sphingobacterium cellulitidis]GGE21528.1 putative metal-dependent hydrolase [Sphingobacterium soli]
MLKDQLEKLRYPIGKFSQPEHINQETIDSWIKTIAKFPEYLRNEIQKLQDKDFELTYREDGWTIRQLIHHCADSHMNSFIRFKLALTEDTPTIKTYKEDLWANLPDSNMPIESSMKILDGLHQRWATLLSNLSQQDLKKQFRNPESNKTISIETAIGIYAWHCNHHLTHIINAKKL